MASSLIRLGEIPMRCGLSEEPAGSKSRKRLEARNRTRRRRTTRIREGSPSARDTDVRDVALLRVKADLHGQSGRLLEG